MNVAQWSPARVLGIDETTWVEIDETTWVELGIDETTWMRLEQRGSTKQRAHRRNNVRGERQTASIAHIACVSADEEASSGWRDSETPSI